MLEIGLFFTLKLYLRKTDFIFKLKHFDKTEYLEIEMFLTIKMCTHAKLNCLK